MLVQLVQLEVQPLPPPLRLNLLFFSRPEQCGGECWHVNLSSEEQCSRVNLRPIYGLSLFHINAMIGVKMGRTRLYVGAGDVEQAWGKLPMCVTGDPLGLMFDIKIGTINVGTGDMKQTCWGKLAVRHCGFPADCPAMSFVFVCWHIYQTYESVELRLTENPLSSMFDTQS